MTQFSPNQLAVADSIDELEVGQVVEFANGVTVERESPTRFVIEDKTLCFIEACQIAMQGIDAAVSIS